MLVLPSMDELAVCKQILIIMCTGVLLSTAGCTIPCVYSDRHWVLCCMHVVNSMCHQVDKKQQDELLLVHR